MNRRRLILGCAIVLTVVGAGWVLSQPAAPPEISAELIGVQSGPDREGFARADKPRVFEFPADHGPHPEYQTEWWYYTGNLDTDDGRHFGYQLTFFRRALTPTAPQRASEWGTNQVYMAHFAITDVAGRRFHSFERFSRGAAGLAGASGTPYRVWLESWSAQAEDEGTMRLRAADGDVGLDLTLRQVKPPALHGEAGLSQKSAEPGNASYYYSLTRLETHGTMTVGTATYKVQGLSWMDHEFGTSYLAAYHRGWDWFSLQLDNDQELMFFQIREEDGSIEPLSGGSLITADGRVHHLNRDDVTLQVLGTWTSPKSGAEYPAGWHLSVPGINLELDIRPLAADQELNVSYAYWEGAVQVTGSRPDGSVAGVGYVEMTGYARSMQGEF